MAAIMNHYKAKDSDTNPLRMFITGGAGVGKSYLTRVVIEWLRLCTAKFCGHNPVIVTAPTGTTARNINGLTLHCTLKLPVQYGREEPHFVKASANTLKALC